MNEDTNSILTEIRDNQRAALELQREQFAFIKKHYDRAEAIQHKAEKMQDRAAQAMKVILPLIGICLIMIGVILAMPFLR